MKVSAARLRRPLRLRPRGRAGPGAGLALGLVASWLVFGSGYVGLKMAIATLPPYLAAGSRFLLAGALLVAWSMWRRPRALATLTARDLVNTFLAGLALIVGGLGGVTWASQYLPPGITAVLASMAPLWVALLGRPVLRQRIPVPGLVGLVAGFAGVAFLASPSSEAGVRMAPMLVVVGASVSWAVGSIVATRIRPGLAPVLAAGLQALLGGAVLVVVGLATGEAAQLRPGQVSLESLLALAWLVLVPSMVGLPLLLWLLRRTHPAVANTQSYLAPVVAFALGTVLLGEQVTPRTVLAVGVILAGVAAMVSGGLLARGDRPADVVEVQAEPSERKAA